MYIACFTRDARSRRGAGGGEGGGVGGGGGCSDASDFGSVSVRSGRF